MREILTILPRIILGLSAGFVVSGGVVAFISIIGLIPLMSHRMGIKHYALWYENAIILGAVAGSILSMWEPEIRIWPIVIVILLFGFGIFVGGLIIALAEVLDVLPIINRRIHIRKGVSLFTISLALGKLIGSLYYWLCPLFLEVIR